MGKACASHCCDHPPIQANSPRYRRILWLALALNAGMFAVEIYFGTSSQSVSLLADAIDFFGDAVNYGVSLWALTSTALARSNVALSKGLVMLGYGVYIALLALYNAIVGSQPEPIVMGAIGTLALATNVVVALLLYAYREGDANMRSVWLCSRNDALGNIAILLAALGVLGTASHWPDLIVASVMAGLGISAGVSVIRQAYAERAALKSGAHAAHEHTHV